MARQPGADRATEMAGELVGAEIPVATRRGRSEGVQQCAAARGTPAVLRAGAVSLQHLPVAHTQRAVDPDLVESALVIQWHLAAVAVG